MKTCRNCGMQIQDDSKFCSFCGTEIKEETNRKQFCSKCGAKLIPENNFCTSCGARVNQPENNQVVNQQPITWDVNTQESMEFQQQDVAATNAAVPEKDNSANKKKTKKRLCISGSILLVIALIFGVFSYVMYSKKKEFKDYIVQYQKEHDRYLSLGEYEDDYEIYLDEANTLVRQFGFQKLDDQKSKMKSLMNKVKLLNEKVAQYQSNYDNIVQQLENNSKYFLGDYTDQYNTCKEDCIKALSSFDEAKSKETTEELSTLADTIISYNQEESQNMLNDAEKIIMSPQYYDCEKFIMKQMYDIIKESFSNQKYQNVKNKYDELKENQSLFYDNGNIHIDSFTQADVSNESMVNLYFSYQNDEVWDEDSFLVYEKNKKDWVKCDVTSVQRIDGNMTMDLVADISGSMYDQFYEMQNALTYFTNSTDANTSLGLSTISSIYERVQEFTTDKTMIIDAINGLNCDGLTSLYQSLYSSVLYTATSSGSKCVVAFTDGFNEPYGTGFDYSVNDVISVSNTYQIPIYIIGIGNCIDEPALQNIANSTGGNYWSINNVADLRNIYEQIYNQQKKTYQITYKSSISNSENREIYVLGNSMGGNVNIRFEEPLEAAILSEAYDNSNILLGDDLTKYYTKKKYLSQVDLKNITSVNDIQTIINIYFAKNGYKFSKAFDEMKRLGVINKNGTKTQDQALKKIKKNDILYKNYMALYNYRYELIYSISEEVYNNGYTAKDEFIQEVNSRIGENDLTRFSDVKKIYKILTSN